MLKYFTLSLLLAVSGILTAQNNNVYATETFRDTRIISGQSVETSIQGQAKFIISHRFGDIYQENPFSLLYNFFGFSGGTNMRIGLDYGITNWLTVGAGRSNLDKTYDGFVKVKLLKQSTGDFNCPVTLSFYSDISVITDTTNEILKPYFTSGIGYANQLLIGRKFSDGFSLQLMPTHIHRNLVDLNSDPNDVFAIGIATKVRVAKSIDLTGEYYYILPNQLPAGYDNCLSIGADFITKGHVFQLQLSNSPYLIPEHYIGRTQGNIFEMVNGKPDINIRFGFNITRTFKVNGRPYE